MPGYPTMHDRVLAADGLLRFCDRGLRPTCGWAGSRLASLAGPTTAAARTACPWRVVEGRRLPLGIGCALWEAARAFDALDPAAPCREPELFRFFFAEKPVPPGRCNFASLRHGRGIRVYPDTVPEAHKLFNSGAVVRSFETSVVREAVDLNPCRRPSLVDPSSVPTDNCVPSTAPAGW